MSASGGVAEWLAALAPTSPRSILYGAVSLSPTAARSRSSGIYPLRQRKVSVTVVCFCDTHNVLEERNVHMGAGWHVVAVP